MPNPRVFSRPPIAMDALLDRRDLLRVASVGVAGTLLPLSSPETVRAKSAAKAKSVILLWMAGGVTHIDSFDPKPDAPQEVRGSLGAIASAIPGTRFCETLPCLARQVRHLALVRSFASDTADHFLGQAAALSGRKVTAAQITTEPNIGSIVSRLHGPRAGFPGYLAVPGITRPGPPSTNLFTGGWLGRQYDPFATGGKPRHEDFTARVREAEEEDFNSQALSYPADVDAQRLANRGSLRQRLEIDLRRLEKQAKNDVLNENYRSAFDMLTSPRVRQAFDLREEAGATRDRYGRTKIGQRCLLARRLVEAGARFVMVDYGYDPEYGNLWDNHNDPVQKHPPICQIVKLPYHLAGTDRAFAAMLEDLHDRQLLSETLVVFMTEFGRTPKINNLGGRDHWSGCGSMFFAGGGTHGGQIVGASDRYGAFPLGSAFGPGDVAATIFQAIGVEADHLLYDRQNRPILVLPQGIPIPGIL